MVINHLLIASWWLNHPSEKYVRQIGFIFPKFRGEHSKNIWVATTQIGMILEPLIRSSKHPNAGWPPMDDSCVARFKARSKRPSAAASERLDGKTPGCGRGKKVLISRSELHKSTIWVYYHTNSNQPFGYIIIQITTNHLVFTYKTPTNPWMYSYIYLHENYTNQPFMLVKFIQFHGSYDSRIIAFRKWFRKYGDRKSPKDRVVGPLPNSLFMAYKMGVMDITTYIHPLGWSSKWTPIKQLGSAFLDLK